METAIEVVKHNRHMNLSTIHKGYLVRKTYIGYTKAEAKKLFIVYLKTLS